MQGTDPVFVTFVTDLWTAMLDLTSEPGSIRERV